MGNEVTEVPLLTKKRIAINRHKFSLTLLKIIVSAGLCYWILRNTNLQEIFSAISAANPLLLSLAFLLHIFGFTISAYRWRTLLRSRGTDASIPFLIESYIVGVFFNNFLPSTIGGDAYRAYDSWRLGQHKSDAVAVVFVDRFLGLLSLVIFAFVAILASTELKEKIPGVYLWITLGTIGMIGVVWLIFMPSPRLRAMIEKIQFPLLRKMRNIVEAFLAFQGQQYVLIKALALSLLLQANVILHYYLIAYALNLSISLFSFFLIIPLATVIMMLPVSVNAIGVRENVFAFFFAAFAVSKPEAVAFAWLAYGMVVLQGMFGGILYSLRR